MLRDWQNCYRRDFPIARLFQTRRGKAVTQNPLLDDRPGLPRQRRVVERVRENAIETRDSTRLEQAPQVIEFVEDEQPAELPGRSQRNRGDDL